MSETYINIRIAWWHIQALRGSLWAWRIVANNFWRERGKWRHSPLAIYDFDILAGWRARKDGVPQAVEL